MGGTAQLDVFYVFVEFFFKTQCFFLQETTRLLRTKTTYKCLKTSKCRVFVGAVDGPAGLLCHPGYCMDLSCIAGKPEIVV